MSSRVLVYHALRKRRRGGGRERGGRTERRKRERHRATLKVDEHLTFVRVSS